MRIRRFGDLLERGTSGRIAHMAKSLNADDIFPLIACLTMEERMRLLRLISVRPGIDDRDAYRALPATREEFSNDEEPLGWDADGWEGVG